MHIYDKLECVFVVFDEASERDRLWLREGAGSRPVLTTYLFLPILIKSMPVDAPISIKIGTAVLVSAHGDVIRVHVLSLINNLSFIDELLLNILRTIRIENWNEKEFALGKHLFVVFIVLNDSLVNQF